ncbi:MAG: hypothetical protein N3A58_00690 [Spirochaetes bacterium]|nr:hypothetical protein [Spirochaetota bacterium]
MFNFEIDKLNELLNFTENFIFNKEQADIDKIQEKLVFSTIFGKESFFNLEKFYKKGDEDKIKIDYQLQKEGKEFFLNNKNLLEKLKIELSSVKNIRSTYLSNFNLLDETDLYDLKIFILKYNNIFNLFKITNINLDLYNIELNEILEIFDPFNKENPTFYLHQDIDLEYKKLINDKDILISELKKEEKNYLSKLNKNFNINFMFDCPKIILKEDKIYNLIIQNLDNFIVLEENYIYIKVTPKKNEAILNIEYQIQEIDKKIYEKKIEILNYISQKIFLRKNDILKAFINIGILDSFLTKVTFAIQINGIIPEIDYNCFNIEEGRNLYLEESLLAKNLKYTPLSINLSKGVSIITGSNMGGKTCILKTIAQIAYLVHAGLMVPAKKITIPLFNGIFISGPEKTLIQEGLSSFGYEIFTLKNIWKEKDNFYLFLFDEPAKGTNPQEGKAIARTIAYFLSTSNSFSLISTHYEGISKDINCKKFRIKGIDEEKVSKLISIITNKVFPQEKIIEMIDHSIVEIKDELEVPKNAITLLSLFSFDKSFIEKCIEFLDQN